MLREMNQLQGKYDMSKVVKLTETEERMIVLRGHGEEKIRNCCPTGTNFQLCKIKF